MGGCSLAFVAPVPRASGLPIGVAVLCREDMGLVSGLVQRLEAGDFEEMVRHRPEQRVSVLRQLSF